MVKGIQKIELEVKLSRNKKQFLLDKILNECVGAWDWELNLQLTQKEVSGIRNWIVYQDIETENFSVKVTKKLFEEFQALTLYTKEKLKC